MILYTNGCSFTWGDELSNRNSRFASLLANKLNCKLVDSSMNGSSNERILRTTFDYLQDPKTDLENLIVVIGWSGISRTEIYNNGWDTITPTMMGTDTKAIEYYKHIQSEQQDNLKFYNQVLLLQLWLEKHNVKYFMFRIDSGQVKMVVKDGSNREVSDGYDTTHLSQQQIKDINLKTFPSYISNTLTFREYGIQNGGGLKPHGHPDEKSHELFTQYLYNIIQ